MRRENGLSLIELSAVVAILGIIALVVVPDFSSAQPKRLELAANRVAEALRFARSEAMRTGEPHGVTIGVPAQEVTVKRWDLTTDPVSAASIPEDPLGRHAFRLAVDELGPTPGVRIVNTADAFLYVGVGRQASLIFDPHGVPLWVDGADGSTHRLQEGMVILAAGRETRSVSVAPLTGRVTVQ